MKELIYVLSDVVHHLQRERGCASMFLGSAGSLFAERLRDQFDESDAVMTRFNDGWGEWKECLHGLHVKKIHTVLARFDELSGVRENVLKRSVGAAYPIDFYSHYLIGAVLQCMLEIALCIKDYNPICISVYNTFLQWKERVGIERALGVRGLVDGGFRNTEFIERVSFLLSEQRSYQSTYMILANDLQKQLVVDAMESDGCKKLESLHEAIGNLRGEALQNVSPEEWFDMISEKIDVLHSVEKKLIDDLGGGTESVSNVKSVPSVVKGAEEGDLGEYSRFVRSLRLFSGLSRDELDNLLRHSSVREFSKGKLLFLEGEHANRLYIVLRGWVKIFKGTANGEETILQMSSAGDLIMESAVFLNTTFPVSSQVVEDATLLSMPASTVREQVKGNNKFALNMLASMSSCSQGLIHQIENARLKSVDERIGWFLLKLLLQQGRVSRCIELPYDKSLIASYLDMKRETFSRSLKRLKGKGFRIENDIIVMPDLQALCGFCDQDTREMCELNGTVDCPHHA